jgi:magnesium transporter
MVETKKEKNKIEKIKSKDTNLTWVCINNQNEKELQYLRRTYKFHHLDLEDCASGIQRPKIDEYDDYIFIVLHVPVNSIRKKLIKNSEIYIFVGKNFVVTLHEDNPTIKKVFDRLKKNKRLKDEYMGKGSGYLLYMITDDLFESAFPILEALDKQINELETEMFDSDQSKDRLKEILLLKKDIINFRRIIMPQRTLVAQLEHKNQKFIPEDLDVYFDEIVDKIEKMWNTLENLQELVNSLQDTNESIMSHNTNNVIKILTVFSVIMLPLTFITGFYGMNVKGLPLAEHQSSTFFIVGVLAFVVISMISYFRYKKWI